MVLFAQFIPVSSVAILTVLECWLDTALQWCSAEQMEEKGFPLSFPAWTGIHDTDKDTKKYIAAEAQMSLERHPAALLNPVGMSAG